MIRNIISISVILCVTAVGVTLNLIFLPLHNIGMILWSRLLLSIAGVRLKVSGRENIHSEGPYIFIINHESALDIPIAAAATRKPSRFMAKKELFRVPLFGWLLKLTHHIPIDRSNRQKAIQSINTVADKLVKKKISIIVSPEGTRSEDGTIKRFKKGAFHLADSYGIPLVPVTIMGARYCIPNKSLRIVPGEVDVHIDPPVYTNEYPDLDVCIQEFRRGMIVLKEDYERKRSART